jgi:hypothetical protein
MRWKCATSVMVDCLSVEAGTSCKSYNELIQSNDKDVLNALGGANK